MRTAVLLFTTLAGGTLVTAQSMDVPSLDSIVGSGLIPAACNTACSVLAAVQARCGGTDEAAYSRTCTDMCVAPERDDLVICLACITDTDTDGPLVDLFHNELENYCATYVPEPEFSGEPTPAGPASTDAVDPATLTSKPAGSSAAATPAASSVRSGVAAPPGVGTGASASASKSAGAGASAVPSTVNAAAAQGFNIVAVFVAIVGAAFIAD